MVEVLSHVGITNARELASNSQTSSSAPSSSPR